MATIIERIDKQVEALKTEKTRIQAQSATDLAAVDAQIDVLKEAKKAITPAVETAYVALKAAGFIKDI